MGIVLSAYFVALIVGVPAGTWIADRMAVADRVPGFVPPGRGSPGLPLGARCPSFRSGARETGWKGSTLPTAVFSRRSSP